MSFVIPDLETRIENVKRLYKEKMKADVDLDNVKTLTEKLQWIKVYDVTEKKQQWTDKLKARELCTKLLDETYLVPMYACYDNAEDIDFGSLPNQFIMRCTHSSSMNQVVLDKSSLDTGEVVAKFNKWLNTSIADKGAEYQYCGITPRVMINKYLPKFVEYQLYYLNNRLAWYVVDRYEEGVKLIETRTVYNTLNDFADFHTMPTNLGYLRTRKLSEVFHVGEILSRDFLVARVDLLQTKHNLYFNELTFMPAGGFIKFFPKEFDLRYGDNLRLWNE